MSEGLPATLLDMTLPARAVPAAQCSSPMTFCSQSRSAQVVNMQHPLRPSEAVEGDFACRGTCAKAQKISGRTSHWAQPLASSSLRPGHLHAISAASACEGTLCDSLQARGHTLCYTGRCDSHQACASSGTCCVCACPKACRETSLLSCCRFHTAP